MSKNVAVFVDVANIFYAAKAAGVDIDYVTLLKSATAGRDFVRAYAYTGLDPENDNQRQFHGFLARSGYKVVSKDIRKYGDGRIKANLDIELVVDMMRMAEHLDIAVVVSGDGDFAPAIRAVQQMGVRVEVISFRGNTSSDLIEVADVFVDISQIAKVEKGVRSGRRVATEDDLSMTEVPDKEAGVTPRRRRTRRVEDEEKVDRAVVAVEERARPAAPGLVALPGEKLSRAAAGEAAAGQAALEAAVAAEDMGGERRRRRRGGRGRGRGGRGPEQVAVAVGQVGPEPPDEELVPEYPDEVPTLPQHSTFGSVWDSQIGLPPATSAAGYPPVEDLEDEPEVPEYLLAEKRQQARRRGGRGRGARQGGYRSAIDRERYGPAQSGGYPASSRPGSAARRSPAPARRGPESGPADRTVPSGEPWSEVPPEVQELLRAEVARRQSPGAASTTEAPAAPAVEAAAAKPRARRSTRSKAASTTEAPAAPAAEAAAAKPRARRSTRSKAASTTEAAGADASDG